MSQVKSPYPGGPRRQGTSSSKQAPLSTEERYDRRDARRRRRKDRKRRASTFAVIGVAMAVAATMGYMLGDQTRRVEGTADGRDALTTDELITSEMNRLLMELWEMESLEQR